MAETDTERNSTPQKSLEPRLGRPAGIGRWQRLLRYMASPWPLLAGAVIIVGLVLRLTVVDNSFWYDEIISASRYFPLSLTDLASLPMHPNNHPLYSMVVHSFQAVFGEGEIQARLPSLAAWVGVLAFGWLLANRWFDRRVAWTFTILATLAFWQYRFATEARGYELATALGLAGTYYLVSGVFEGRPRRVLIAVPLFSLAAYAHLYASTLLAGALVIWILGAWEAPSSDRTRTGLWAIGWLVVTTTLIGLVYSPIVNPVEVIRSLIVEGAAPGILALTEVQDFDFGYLVRLPGLMTSGTGATVASLAASAAWLLGVAASRRRPAALAVTVVPAAVVTGAAVMSLVFYPRFFVVAQPYFLIGIAAGLVWVTGWMKSDPAHGVAAASLAVALLLVPVGGISDNFPQARRDWAGAASFVESTGFEYVVAYPLTEGWSVVRESLAYYLERTAIHELASGPLPAGASAAFVTLVGYEEPSWGLPLGRPHRFGDVAVYSLQWDGRRFQAAPAT